MGCCSGKTAVQSSRPLRPLRFSRTHARVTIAADGLTATKIGGGKDRVAAVEEVIQTGRHFVEFTRSGSNVLVGLIRPEFDAEEGTEAHKEAEHCFYQCDGGYKYPGGASWGSSTGSAEGDRIGLLLDLEAGSLVVFKNDERVGMIAAGLTGRYCWAAVLYDKDSSVTMKRLEPPKKTAANMTEEEAAVVIQAQVRLKADETRPAE